MGKAKILYIEDNFDNMTLVQRVLEIEGYEVIPAGTGQAGLDLALTGKPDIIITDINLPDIDGYKITDTLKRDAKTAHIPIIAMTANVMKKDRENVFEAGCDGFISKPINTRTFPDQIAAFITKKA